MDTLTQAFAAQQVSFYYGYFFYGYSKARGKV
jgi:hypothetical protein